MSRLPPDWDERYQSRETPWDTGRPSGHLQRTVQQHPIAPCRVLEVGCGTGTNAIWLSEQGFSVVATDISDEALALAREKVARAQVDVSLQRGTFPEAGQRSELLFDRGCFHSLGSLAARVRFAHRAAEQLEPDGLWLSLMGSKDGPAPEHGPPRLAALEIVSLVEPHFEILVLESVLFEAKLPAPPRGWRCLMKRR